MADAKDTAPGRPAAAKAAPAPKEHDEAADLRRERDELRERLDRALKAPAIERRPSIDPRDEEFDVAHAVHTLWPLQGERQDKD